MANLLFALWLGRPELSGIASPPFIFAAARRSLTLYPVGQLSWMAGFLMAMKNRAKGADRAVSISAASAITGVEVHTLRYWEREFAEYLQPVRTEGGQRRYRPEDIQVLFTIKRLLRDEMFSIAGARKYLQLQYTRAA